MADYDRRQGGRGNFNSRKRRHQEDDDYDRRGPRRRVDAPPHIRLRKQLLAIGENPMRPWHEEATSIATLFTENIDGDELLRGNTTDLIAQIAVEQPLKTPFLAAVILVANTQRPEVVDELLGKLATGLETRIAAGEWREAKLLLKLLACLQGLLEGDGVFPLLEELFSRAVDLQTASSEDTIGTELVKIILFTIPYILATSPTRWAQKAIELLDKTDIIASEPHALHTLIDPYVPEGEEPSPLAGSSLISLLQKQLQAEANNGWELACLPRPWDFPVEDVEQRAKMDDAAKHALPAITVPADVIAGPRPLFPEIYFSVYADQEVESVPSVNNIAASLVRDGLLDTINTLHFNRNITARHLIEVDCFFAPRTFAARATPYDRLREIEPTRSTWKPEDVAVDAVFSQLFLLPVPEHKLVYYHAVLTEACKLAPAAIAPSLGRAIRYLYRNLYQIDIELVSRFIDWFAHHLSNFGFTWKWTEWIDDVELPDLNPRKAFILGAIDKEIRLSFAQRIKNTLPEPYKGLITLDMEKDVPDFKFRDDQTPFAEEGRELAALLKRKAPDEEIQPVIERIHSLALDGSLDPLVASTDVFVTAVLHVGSKSLSHVLAAIERTKDRMLDAGAASEAARAQIISAVMAYWGGHPGVALSIIEKLLNYGIVSPMAVTQWALVGQAGRGKGEPLAVAYVYEMVFNTVIKVTGRVRQLASAQHNSRAASASSKPAVPELDTSMDGNDAAEGAKKNGEESAPAEETEADRETRAREIAAMRDLFRAMDDSLVSWAAGSKDELMEMADADGDGDGERGRLVRRWGTRWLRAFRRRAAIEEAFLLDAGKRDAAAKKAAAGEENGGA